MIMIVTCINTFRQQRILILIFVNSLKTFRMWRVPFCTTDIYQTRNKPLWGCDGPNYAAPSPGKNF